MTSPILITGNCYPLGSLLPVNNVYFCRQLICNTLGINLWGDWEMKQEFPPEVKRGRMEDGDRRGRMDLDKLSEMERRMGLGSDRGRDRERASVGAGGGGGGKRDWY